MVEVVIVLEHRAPYVLRPEPVVPPTFCRVPANPILAAHPRNSQSGTYRIFLPKADWTNSTAKAAEALP